MALVFRWYLGLSTVGPSTGDPIGSWRLPNLVWSGDGRVQRVGSAGSYLEQPEHRNVDQVALNLLEGAAQISRAAAGAHLRCARPDERIPLLPRPLSL